ncbi:hypothetical protein BJY01DRAFT_217711 [Aspergillus pseudoustus]|uniref:Mid2 domain-containing protein n=1 Tax=Aspergillus pseudoustus TaxID=1810923 RepID=A0ABR4JMF6_9EURO
MGLREIGLVLLLASRASSTCYYRDGTIANNDEPCPNSNICCPSGDTCMDNLLCRDKNNFANGSTVTFPGGTYNYTDLYHTSSCQSQSYNGCSIQCTTYDSDSGEYIWACDSALTSYCCHSDPESLAQYDCCQNGTFSLASPSQDTSTSTSMTSSLTPSGSTSPTSTTSDLSATTAPNTIEPDPSSSLSTGAKAGIGVGAAVAGITAISLVIVLVRSRRKREKARVNEQVIAEMPSDLSSPQEMDGTARPPELGVKEGFRRVYELGP